MPADNKRFGVSRGVCSWKVLREFESLSPVRTLVFPHPHAKPPQRKKFTKKSKLIGQNVLLFQQFITSFHQINTTFVFDKS